MIKPSPSHQATTEVDPRGYLRVFFYTWNNGISSCSKLTQSNSLTVSMSQRADALSITQAKGKRGHLCKKQSAKETVPKMSQIFFLRSPTIPYLKGGELLHRQSTTIGIRKLASIALSLLYCPVLWIATAKHMVQWGVDRTKSDQPLWTSGSQLYAFPFNMHNYTYLLQLAPNSPSFASCGKRHLFPQPIACIL